MENSSSKWPNLLGARQYRVGARFDIDETFMISSLSHGWKFVNGNKVLAEPIVNRVEEAERAKSGHWQGSHWITSDPIMAPSGASRLQANPGYVLTWRAAGTEFQPFKVRIRDPFMIEVQDPRPVWSNFGS